MHNAHIAATLDALMWDCSQKARRFLGTYEDLTPYLSTRSEIRTYRQILHALGSFYREML